MTCVTELIQTYFHIYGNVTSHFKNNTQACELNLWLYVDLYFVSDFTYLWFPIILPQKMIEKNTNVQLSFMQQKHVRAQPQIYGNWTSNLW